MQTTSEWVTVIISVLALIVSVLAFLNARNSSRANEMQFIKQNIDNAKSTIEDMMISLTKLTAKRDANTITGEEELELNYRFKILNAAEERLLNAVEDGCDKFHKKQVKKQDFTDRYHEDIARYVKTYQDKFNGFTSFCNMRDYYVRYHQKPKV